MEKIALGQLNIPTDRQGFTQLDYDGPAGTFPTYSLADVVATPIAPKPLPGQAGHDWAD